MELKTVSEISYYHFGLRNMVDHNMKKYRKILILIRFRTFIFFFNVDGLSLIKSSCTRVWPLCKHRDSCMEENSLSTIYTFKFILKMMPVSLHVWKTVVDGLKNLDYLQMNESTQRLELNQSHSYYTQCKLNWQ